MVAFSFPNPRHNARTADHAIPRSQLGRHRYSNLVPACHFCNQLRSNMSALEYEIIAEEIVEPNRDNFVVMLIKLEDTPLVRSDRLKHIQGFVLSMMDEYQRARYVALTQPGIPIPDNPNQIAPHQAAWTPARNPRRLRQQEAEWDGLVEEVSDGRLSREPVPEGH